MKLEYRVVVDDHPEGVLLTTQQKFDDGRMFSQMQTISRELVAIKDDAVQAALLRDPRFVARLLQAGWIPPKE
jgi:hypothetical protein